MMIETMNSAFCFSTPNLSPSVASFFMLGDGFWVCERVSALLRFGIHIWFYNIVSGYAEADFFALAYFFLYSTLNASVALKCVPNEMHINTKFMEADAIVIYTLAFSSKPKEMIQEFDYIHFTSEHTTIWTVCL